MGKLFICLWLCVNCLYAVPPREIPKGLYADFTLGGQIPVHYSYYDNTYSSNLPLIYDFDTIEALKKKAMAREKNYYWYVDTYIYNALDQYKSFIQGNKVAVMGSNVPWYEAMVMVYGGTPVTIEYNKIVSHHPDLTAITLDQYAANPELFDCILSISSYEHDGLGRYGDPINPIGDLIAMEKTKKMLKPGGILILAVPVGEDYVVWNAHRVYGAKRLPLLLKGWKVLNTFGFKDEDLYRQGHEQPIFILQVEESKS